MMNVTMSPITPWIDWKYWLLACVVSLYYAIRAIVIQRHHVHDENRQREEEKKLPWSSREIIFVHMIQDSIYNFVGAMAGFVALYLEYKILMSIRDLTKIDAGTAILLGFFPLLAVVGIGGQLPWILLHGKLFGGRQ